ncbi:hypothetical protein JCGZ_18500 [Jatropha curcas]|uniref:Uncharacterized protein n=1 Tax=Jatropha curcas TaxID=180498 RepID=A0A067K124_JATCU|nr:hypothetical protein JCGZ_18500 [Jatropha curcas]
MLLTSLLTILTIILNFSKQKPVEKSIEDETISVPDQGSSPKIVQDKDIVSKESKKEEDQEEEEEEEEEDNYLARSSTSEDSEVEWSFQDKIFRSSDCSDGSISDEESLIEIALPSGHYIGHNNKEDEESNKFINMRKKLPDFASAGSLLKQHGGLMELLAELNDMNEEENLIEIDISIGSIKCPRFEIEA